MMSCQLSPISHLEIKFEAYSECLIEFSLYFGKVELMHKWHKRYFVLKNVSPISKNIIAEL